MMQHQYVDRSTGEVRNETLFADRLVNMLYSSTRENAPLLFKALTGARVSEVLGFLNYDLGLGAKMSGQKTFLRKLGVDMLECLKDPATLDTPRKVFERKIRYWTCRPIPGNPDIVVSPADAKVLVGSLNDHSALFLKDKFFGFEEMLGHDRKHWLSAFAGGDFAVFRLTPEKYHYNHTPVAGVVRDIYEVAGHYHSCNPGAVVLEATPYSKNKRTVSIIDTDVKGGTGVGLVAMIEVVALMIGEVVQAYSDHRYDVPRAIIPGDFLQRGVPKSLYRPGSSTDVLLFQPGRIEFDADLVRNLSRADAKSRFSLGFGAPLVETDVQVRSSIGVATRSVNQLEIRRTRHA